MGGVLGNLLTGELGEAEARFERDDFAQVCGRRVTQRVRRRRAVRAAGVGGGTMLTAGAVALAATNVRWDTWGAAAPGAGDCATPSAVAAGSDGAIPSVAMADGAQYRVIDGAGSVVAVSQEPDGTIWVTHENGERVQIAPDADGLVASVGSDGEQRIVVTVYHDGSGELAEGAVTYTVEPAPANASSDCYTPSPAPSASVSSAPNPSVEPTLAAKPEDVMGDSPFECGFEFPTESYGTEDLWIDGLTWTDGAEVEAEIRGGFENPADANIVSPTGAIPGASVHYASADRAAGIGGGFHAIYTTEDPSNAKYREAVPDATGFEMGASVGHTFVGAVDGKVVATYTLTDGAPLPFWVALTQPDGSAIMQLLDGGRELASCDSSPVDLANVDLVAVVGLAAEHADGTVDPTIYAWLPVGRP